MELREGARVLVTWTESGTKFAAKIVSVADDDDSFEVLYDDRVRGKEVFEKNVVKSRLEPWTGSEEQMGSLEEVGEGSSVSNRRVSANSDAMGLIQRLAQMREDGDLDVQTVTLTPAQIVQLHDTLSIPTSK